MIIFTRYPEPGRTKTRLIAALGPDGAARLQRQMTEHALRRVAAPPDAGPRWHASIRFDGGDTARMAAWLGSDWTCVPQGAGDLGHRMQRACEDAFALGHTAAIVIGTDCPDLSAVHIAEALRRVESHSVVLGPAADGGYYLVGLSARAASAALPALFDDMPWGTAELLTQTLARLDGAGLTHALLAPLRDVDVPQDLPVWEAAQARHRNGDTGVHASE